LFIALTVEKSSITMFSKIVSTGWYRGWDERRTSSADADKPARRDVKSGGSRV